MNSTLRILPIVVVAVLTARGAPASGEDAWISGALSTDYLQNTDRGASAFDCRLELDGGLGPVALGVVYRAYQLSDPGYDPAGVGQPLSEIRHRYAELSQDAFSARVGHFFSTFGHGLTLRSYEDVDLEHDTVLDGLVVSARAGAVDVTALSGAATEVLSDVRNRDHTISGARVSVPVADWLTAAGSAVRRASLERREDDGVAGPEIRFEDSVLGVEMNAWMGPVTVTAEYAGRDGEDPADGSDATRGRGVYAASTLDLGRFTLFGEFKDYEDFEHYLVNPPTCVREHPWTLMNRATYEIDLNDERGFLVEGSALMGDGSHVTGGASEARSHDGELSHWEMFGKVEHELADALATRFGVSWSRDYGDYSLGKFVEHRIGALDLDVALPSGDAAEISVEGQMVEDPALGSYEDYVAGLTLYPGTGLTFSLQVETTTAETSARDVWSSVQLRALVLEDTEVTFGMGTERGGKKCSGGVCYVEPEFDGVRVKLAKFF